ncbi:Prolow-density lipoprotein receptor-related protein 1 [Halotydeus destructor]|nr:Prolow-density lipoprotein receptor-related protein 1 [Halotydeus destructor]
MTRRRPLIVFSLVFLSSLVSRSHSVQVWKRLGPVPADMTIGSSCKSSLQCMMFMPGAHCDWDSRTCSCQPYHIQANLTTCLPASLLGFGCSLDDQCTLKVPNSRCVDGLCQCKSDFVPYRRDKCLAPAKVNDFCLGDDQCKLDNRYTYCKYIIPRIYGKCRCPVGHVTKDGRCLPPLGKRCEANADCLAATAHSYCKTSSFRTSKSDKDAVCTCQSGYRTSNNSMHCDEMPTEKPTPAPTLKPVAAPIINLLDGPNSDDFKVSSLGKPCSSSIECQIRDPYSSCVNGTCECLSPSSKCSSERTGCPKDTFQCRSGQCISWYFVCDKHNNCDDGSDEQFCTEKGCPKEAFQCDDGTCLSRGSVCNGRWECPDGSDEARCYKGISCDSKAHQCKSGQCLPQYAFCNAVADCVDGSDEDESLCEHSAVCPKGTFQCDNGRCRSTAILCSGVDGCGDNSDEDKCEVCCMFSLIFI